MPPKAKSKSTPRRTSRRTASSASASHTQTEGSTEPSLSPASPRHVSHTTKHAIPKDNEPNGGDGPLAGTRARRKRDAHDTEPIKSKRRNPRNDEDIKLESGAGEDAEMDASSDYHWAQEEYGEEEVAEEAEGEEEEEGEGEEEEEEEEEEQEEAHPALKTLEITFSAPEVQLFKQKGITKMDRMIRMNLHKTHLLCLLAHGAIRNRWINEDEIQAMAISVVPPNIVEAFKLKRAKFEHAKGAAFLEALRSLAAWWHTFFTATHLGIRSYDYKVFDIHGDVHGAILSDCVPSPQALVEALVRQEGSWDSCAQLFTAVARGLGLEARLVLSLQAVSWRYGGKGAGGNGGGGKKSATRKKTGGSATPAEEKQRSSKATKKSEASSNNATSDGGGDSDYRETPRLSSASFRAPKRRKPSANASPPSSSSSSSFTSIAKNLPPVMWCEVYSKHEERWVPVDPVRGLVAQPKAMDPPANCVENGLAYAVAFESEGYARDVTRRYASQWGARTMRNRLPEKEGDAWWREVMRGFEKPYKLPRDAVEEAELQEEEVKEAMPGTLDGFRNHPLYVLESQLKKFEIVKPSAVVLGEFRGKKIYSRSEVYVLHTAETWMKEAKVIREGEQPLKFVKARAATLSKKRAQEMALMTGDSAQIQVGLYAEWQVEDFKPPIIIDGKIPKNSYGNIYLFKPSMLPIGAAHIPYSGTGKIAKKLGVDYAEAVVDFDFRQRRCLPVTRGIVVAEEHYDLVLEAFMNHTDYKNQVEADKREKAILGRWRKLVQALQVSHRLKAEYGAHSEEHREMEDFGESQLMQGGFILDEDDGVGREIAGRAEEAEAGGEDQDGDEDEDEGASQLRRDSDGEGGENMKEEGESGGAQSSGKHGSSRPRRITADTEDEDSSEDERASQYLSDSDDE
ncbi:uncharacterized protein VTP21DRAFT_4388 [Calcarisporiella thermophila]|uniref:uncharacterized protein n=1 Tax=Calcarisporiella thermophila TaxID=911321 RepID=UPI00374389D6